MTDATLSYLTQDHQEIDKMLRDLACIIDDDERERAECAFDELRSRIERHIRIEEDTLFPAFEASIGRPTRGPTFVMSLEHIEIGKLLDDMALAIEEWDTARFLNVQRELEMLLEAHDTREEALFANWPGRAQEVQDEARATQNVREPVAVTR